MEFAVPIDHKMKIKESEKIDKHLDLARELKKVEREGDGDTSCICCTWNRSEKGMEQLEINGRIEIIQTTTLLKSAKILKRVLETWEDSDSSESTPAKAGVENS